MIKKNKASSIRSIKIVSIMMTFISKLYYFSKKTGIRVKQKSDEMYFKCNIF